MGLVGRMPAGRSGGQTTAFQRPSRGIGGVEGDPSGQARNGRVLESLTSFPILTLVRFDTEYEVVHGGVAIENVPEYELVPRGATAHLDAVGRAIIETEARLHRMKKKGRPGLVIFVINTDGLENSSREFVREQRMAHEPVSNAFTEEEREGMQ